MSDFPMSGLETDVRGHVEALAKSVLVLTSFRTFKATHFLYFIKEENDTVSLLIAPWRTHTTYSKVLLMDYYEIATFTQRCSILSDLVEIVTNMKLRACL